MSVRRRECIVITCDVCRCHFREQLGAGPVVHFASMDDARHQLERDGWLIATRDVVICPAASVPHQGARAACDSGAQR